MIQEYIEKHHDELVETLQSLLRIPSVQGEPEPDAPFGQGPADALAYVLKLAADKGLATKVVDGFAGHVEYGTGEEYVGVLAHLDVVPAASGWEHPPFDGVIEGDKIFARGAIDDKGPAMSALWGLIALKELGIQPKRKIRLIFGLDEERDWQCVSHYFQVEPKPLGGFTPDADFPVIYAEKGLAKVRVSVRADSICMTPQVVRFEGGTRPNMVPDYAYAVVECHSELAAQEFEKKLYKDARGRKCEIDVSVNGSRLQVVSRGVAAHASTPQFGVNAILELAALFGGSTISNASMWRAIAAEDTDGKTLGLALSDAVTGALTANLGVANLENNTYEFLYDIRYPIDKTADELMVLCKQYVSDKWEVELLENMEPLYVPLDSPVVRVLTGVYERQTGERAEPIAIGGATYARAIPNAVAFGPLFPGEPDVAHQNDEFWSLNNYFRCVEIYAHAMNELANTL